MSALGDSQIALFTLLVYYVIIKKTHSDTERGEVVITTIIVVAVIIAVIAFIFAVRTAYRNGRQDGLQHPTEEATKRLQQVEGAIKTKRKELADFRKELDLLSPQEARVDRMRRQKKEVVRLTEQIKGTRGTISMLTRDIARLLDEAARNPAVAEMIFTDAQVTVLQNQRLAAESLLGELQMDLAKAEGTLIEFADELSTLRQTVSISA